MPATITEPPARIYRLTVNQYHRMIETGVLTESDPIELLEGWLVTKMPQNPLHGNTITRVRKKLENLLGDEWVVRGQQPITTRDSEPEPDLAVVSGPLEKYDDRQPTPFDTALGIEVADSSLDFDRTTKGRLYARARLPIYWIVNIQDRIIEVYTDPIAGKRPHYRTRTDYGRDDEVPLVVNGKRIARIPVKDFFPS